MNCELWPSLGFGQAQVHLNHPALVQALHSTWIYALLSFSVMLTPLKSSCAWNAKLQIFLIFFSPLGLSELIYCLQSWKDSQHKAVCGTRPWNTHFFQKTDPLHSGTVPEEEDGDLKEWANSELFEHADVMFSYIHQQFLPASSQNLCNCHGTGIATARGLELSQRLKYPKEDWDDK